jgi:signal transduction histidine kinase
MRDGVVRVLLIADRDEEYRSIQALFAALPPNAYHLDRVADHAAAIQALTDCQHDLYLVDHRVGERSGLEFLSEAQARGCLAPLIVVGGRDDREADLRAMQAGAVDFLVKERLDAAVLERSMRYALRHKRLEEEIRGANQLLEKRVRMRTAELERINALLEAEIAERKRAEELLRDTDRRKDRFLATLAHELRNPLSPLAASCQLISLDPGNADQVLELSVIMSRQLEHLRRLIGDLLDVSRLTTGQLTLRRESVALSEAIAAALDVARPAIEAAGHTLDVRLAPQMLIVSGDKVRLAQAVGNLLVNAAKFTPPGGRIELASNTAGALAEIRVRDTGIGIRPEALSDVFGLFHELDGDAARSQGGLGIGLSLAKAIVEMHGGTIAAHSDGPDRGSEFTIRLPLASDAPRPGGEAARPAATTSPAFRLLIVDDNQSASHLLSRVLEKLGQQVQVASSAGEALALLPSFAPDAVVSDIAMPGVSGYELAKRIRRLPLPKQPLLVALTGYGQDSDRRDALAAGFDQHLTKPIGLPELQKLLETLRGR